MRNSAEWSLPAYQALNVLANTPPPVLEYLNLDISNNSEVVDLFLNSKRPDSLPFIDFSSVEELLLNVSGEICRPNDILGMMPKLTNPSIAINETFLTWHNGTPRLFASDYIDLSSLPTLKDLPLMYSVSSGSEDPYFGAIDELASLASSNCRIESVSLEMLVGMRGCTSDPTIWRKLEDVLNTSNFPFLCEVTLRIEVLSHFMAEREKQHPFKGPADSI
ncbi:hypothetical protein BDN70DRAFT_934121 [Pholiota conissans]|uniref:Uncharacterized protein n=1 Tax=Pholiota conissans TaxID=109636 RepID=A0A9P5YYR9_9AGAR|nr:hypothetical protein BDN70DRAFT_934121 [Pholiota conissans]